MSQEAQTAAQEIALSLGETEAKPCAQIAAIVKHCGIEFARNLLRKTQEVEAQGGMMLPDGSRRRTVGGVFFYLARKQIPKEISEIIFAKPDGEVKAKDKKPKPKNSPPPLPELNWSERVRSIRALASQAGVLTTVKVTLIGRPGQIDSSHKDVIITTMSHVPKAATLPKGVPQPPDTPTLYTLYISARQWRKVEAAITDPDDALIVEGLCAFDEQADGIAVFVQSITSKQLEAQKRQAQKQSSDTSNTGSVTRNASEQAAAPRAIPEFEPSQPSPPTSPELPNVPADIIQKLNELYASASLYRQKIATIQSRPAGQQFGLEMTQKLLKNVEDEIAAIEKKIQD